MLPARAAIGTKNHRVANGLIILAVFTGLARAEPGIIDGPPAIFLGPR